MMLLILLAKSIRAEALDLSVTFRASVSMLQKYLTLSKVAQSALKIRSLEKQYIILKTLVFMVRNVLKQLGRMLR